MSEDEQSRFGKYELLARLAAGGMAEIFKARYAPAPGVSKQVVIKRILPHYAANQAFVAMFTNEARIAMGLSHGNIAQVFDFGEIEGDWFIAMELVDGQPLSKILKRARQQGIAAIPVPLAVWVTAEMLKGLHYAHTRLDEQGQPLKIVHRDVSPQNVLVSYEGQVKLVDFGIAKARTAGRQETEAGAVKGKYAYFSPEQAKGKDLDARSDVFAAGIVLYELLTGQLPFPGRLIEALSAIAKGQFRQPHQLNPAVSPALEAIVLKAMAHDRDDRYQTAEAFEQALTGWLYQTTSGFSASRLTHFMGFLFEPELVAEGRPQRLPPDFQEALAVWRTPLPEPAPPPPSSQAQTSAGRGQLVRTSKPSLPAPTTVDSPRTSEVVFIEPLRARRSWLWALPVLAAVMTGVGVFLYGHLVTFSIQLSSSPPGAQAKLDGQPAGWTPTVLEALSASAPHVLVVTAPGFRPWRQQIDPTPGAVIALHAELEPLPVAPGVAEAPPAESPALDAGNAAAAAAAAIAEAVPMEAAYPASALRLDAKVHVLPMASAGLPQLKLDPAHAYRVWTEGQVSLGGLLDNIFVSECVYFLGPAPGAMARQRFGLAGRTPQTVYRASSLTAFITDQKPNDNSGALKLHVQDATTRVTRTLVVDARAAAHAPEPPQRFTLTHLKQTATYEVVLREGSPPAMTQGLHGGPTGRALFGTEAGITVLQGKALANETQRVLEVGKRYRFGGTSWVWFTFPDDDVTDNSGGLEVEVTEVAGSGGGLFPRLGGSPR